MFARLSTRHLPLALLLLLLLLAGYLRLSGLAHSPVGPDQSILYTIAMRYVNGGLLPLAANKSSAGIMNPPFIEYLLIGPLLVRPLIAAPIVFQALLSLTAVALLYAFTAPLLGARVGLLSVLLFAVNPWAVYYSRFIWNPAPLPIFATLLLGSLLAGLLRQRYRAVHFALVFVWLAAITQLHLSALVLIPTLGLIWLLFWRRWWPADGRRLALLFAPGLVLFLLLYAPFIRYQYAVGFGDLQAVASALAGGRQTITGEVGEARVNPASFLLLLELATGDHIFGSAHDFATRDAWRAQVWPWFGWLWPAYLLVVASLVYALARPLLWWWQQGYQQPLPPRQVALVVLAIWSLVPVLFYLRHTVYLQNYYLLYILPAPFILLALLLDEMVTAVTHSRLSSTGQRALLALILLPLLLFCLWQVNIYQVRLAMAGSSNVEAERQAWHVQAAVDTSRALLEQFPDCDLTIMAEGGEVEKSPLGLVEDFVHPRPTRYAESGRGFIIPSRCTVYLAVNPDPFAAAWLQGSATPVAEPIQTMRESWRFYYVPGGASSSPALANWQNGLTLIAFQLDNGLPDEPRLRLDYLWRVDNLPPEGRRYHFFNHLLNQAGELVAQEDAPGVHSIYWRQGDQLVTQYQLSLPSDLPAGQYSLYTGVYSWPDLERVWLQDGVETTYRVTTVEVP
jgi:4-amino-4-deoxy-L-arabinose transferase-like glycosyltransferase